MVLLPKLLRLYLDGNQFSGKIPFPFNESTPLIELDLSRNRLNGGIPSSLGNCQHLVYLQLQDNNLNGKIPEPIFTLASLSIVLNLSNNSLTGSLPSQVGKLSNLLKLDVSLNKLSGKIPDTLGNCLSLVSMSVQNNFFHGTIPQSLRTLRGIKYLDLSHNKLSGEIPNYLGNLTSLVYLDLSYNQLEGSVPRTGVFANASAISLARNNLCGGVVGLRLSPCRIHTFKKKRKSLTDRIVIPIIVIGLVVILISCLLFIHYQRRREKKISPSSTIIPKYSRVSYVELLKATNCFSTDNLIGTGSFGTVYKGILAHDNKTVAVKVLNLQQQGATKSFISECNALRNIRHRNLLKVITSCSSVDFQGNDFKALVFEYMEKGSLEEWLYLKDENHLLRNLNFLERLNIAIDVASALDYLHNLCEPRIVHCDLKPSNILLDDGLTANVADFGLAKMFSATFDNNPQSDDRSIALKGSIRYIPPEYGMGGDVSIQGDVYSYGILLLEMFTGKKPTDDMFQNGECLHSFARAALPEQVMNIADRKMLLEEGYEDIDFSNQNDACIKMYECLISAIRLGVKCSSELATERINMAEVVTELFHIRDHHQGVRIVG